MPDEVLSVIGRTGIVAILRGLAPEESGPVAEALSKGGVRCVEVTMDTPEALRMIEGCRARYGGRLLVGAGTVTQAAQVREAVAAGAQYILTPALSLPVLEACEACNCLCIPGVFTPTEALAAAQAGAPLLKLFPADRLGPAYLRELRGPLHGLRFLPTGGVDEENAGTFFREGAFALGIGSGLISRKEVREGHCDAIAARAARLIRIAGQHRRAAI